jgi:long-chain acyl-CoA synthetase
MTADTLPKQLRENARIYGGKTALRQKEFGIWQPISWQGFLERVHDFALGLHSLGFERGGHLAIIGDNSREWLISELAAQSLGGTATGIYQDSIAEEVTYISTQCDAQFIIAEDQEQVDKIIEIWDQLSGVEKVIYYDPLGLQNYTEEFLMPFPEVEGLGRALHALQPDLFDQSVDEGKGSDVAIISTTSGTTSKPKLARLTHSNLLAMGDGLTSVDPFDHNHEYVSSLPLAWIGEQMISVACGLRKGFTLNFPEEPETVPQDMREIGPHIVFAPPRIWENILSQVQVKIEDADRTKRALFNWAMNVGQHVADSYFEGRQPGLRHRLLAKLARPLVFQNLLDQFGLSQVRWAYTGGAALGPDVFRFFHAMGVNLKQGYGQTETCGICVVHRDGNIKFQTVGLPLPGVEVVVDDGGEILVKGNVCFKSYHRNPEATAETIDGDWVRTGDAGYFDGDGHLIVIERVKDVMTLYDGTKFSPLFIENKLKFSPYVREAVVFGGDWPFVSAMINIDFGNVGKWAENRHIAYTTYTDLSQKPEVYKLIRKEVERTNADLPPAARIQRFLLLHKELDADDAELTRTRKVRRRFIAGRYDELINGLYSEQASIQIESTITYQDGRTARLQIELHIETMEAGAQRVMG